MKESLRITLPTHISNENNHTVCTQTVQPALGVTPVETHRAQNEPTLMIPQLLEIKTCKDHTEMPIQTLDSLYITQLKRILPLTQVAKKLAEELCREEIASQRAGLPPIKLLQESFVQ